MRVYYSAFQPMATKLSPEHVAPAAGLAAEEGFLAGLGRRVRALRNRRGMTRKMLAVEADVSERHLAQLETGDGNISVLGKAVNWVAGQRGFHPDRVWW